jgi:pyruvate dehydrogenase E1 component alpha subunit
MAKKALENVATRQEYSKEQLVAWYELMLLMRRFEERAGMLYQQQKIRGFCHLYIGQEAVGAGVESAIRPDDYVITAYRDHGNAIARGITPREVMAELYGKATGCTGGRGGSMHMMSAKHNFLGGHGIVGGQIGLGAGAAFAAKYRKEDRVCVSLFGDGAARQGILHETFNMAMLWNLPVVFICENNMYAMGTSVERTSNVTEIYKLGRAYEMPSEQVNGMDVRDVHEAVFEAVQAARDGHGPTLLEVTTYRFRGHSMSDPAKYRTKEELQEFKDRDPLVTLQHFMAESNLITNEELDALEEKVKLVVDDSVEFAESSPWPDGAGIYDMVYAEPNYPFVKD